MTATEALRRGDLATALRELQDQVRSKPQDAESRVFLFQLLAVLGQWERTLTQLNLCGQLDPAALMMVQAYSQVIRCEMLRADVFAGKRTPLVLGEPSTWVALLIQSLSQWAAGQSEAAEKSRDQAFEAAPAHGGSVRWRAAGSGAEEMLKTDRFEWLADADPRLGPLIEAIIDGRYYWVPVGHIRSLHIDPPADLRDLVWLPAQFTWVSGGQQLGFIPTRYPGSENAADDAIRLARLTSWVADDHGFETGLGQRLLATDSGEYSLLDIRQIDWDSPTPAEGESGPHG